MYARDYEVGWGDVDANRHMRSPAYLDYAAQTRFAFLAQHGFTPEAFAAAAIGPAILHDEVSYRRELRFLETFNVDFQVAAQSEDGSRTVLLNRFIREDGKVAAEVKSLFVWLDLNTRRPVAPPPALLAAMNAVDKAEGFQVLEPLSSVKKAA